MLLVVKPLIKDCCKDNRSTLLEWILTRIGRPINSVDCLVNMCG